MGNPPRRSDAREALKPLLLPRRRRVRITKSSSAKLGSNTCCSHFVQLRSVEPTADSSAFFLSSTTGLNSTNAPDRIIRCQNPVSWNTLAEKFAKM